MSRAKWMYPDGREGARHQYPDDNLILGSYATCGPRPAVGCARCLREAAATAAARDRATKRKTLGGWGKVARGCAGRKARAEDKYLPLPPLLVPPRVHAWDK